MLKSILAATLLTGTFMGTALAEKHDHPRHGPVRSITVTGHGEVSVSPDTAILTLGVSSSGETARAALDGNTAAMKKLVEGLRKAGIEPRDIQTSNFSLNEHQSDPNLKSDPSTQPASYDASNVVTIVVRKIDSVGSLLDQAVSEGSNQIHGLTFQVSDPSKAEDTARQRAVEDARHRAELYAASLGAKLGPVQALSENPGGYSPSPMATRAKMASDSPVPVEAGEQVIGIDINVVWDIAPASDAH